MTDSAGADARRAVTIAPLQWQGHSQLAYALREAARHAQRSGACRLASSEPGAERTARPGQPGWAQASAGQSRKLRLRSDRPCGLTPTTPPAHRGLASLCGRARPYNPQQLASAASGFATAVRALPTRSGFGPSVRDATSRRVSGAQDGGHRVRSGAAMAGIISTSATAGVRALCVLGACASGGFGAYFFWRLPAHLRELVRARRWRGRSVISLALLAVGLVLLLATALVPASLVEGLRGWGLAAALIAALIALFPFIARRRTRQKSARKRS